MAVNEDYLQYLKDQLSEFGHFDIKRMFGGIGFFREGTMFAMIGGDVFRLRVGADNIQDFEKSGMTAYNPKKKGKGMPYFEVPIDVIEDKTLLKTWADKSYAVAMKAKKK